MSSMEFHSQLHASLLQEEQIDRYIPSAHSRSTGSFFRNSEGSVGGIDDLFTEGRTSPSLRSNRQQFKPSSPETEATQLYSLLLETGLENYKITSPSDFEHISEGTFLQPELVDLGWQKRNPAFSRSLPFHLRWDGHVPISILEESNRFRQNRVLKFTESSHGFEEEGAIQDPYCASPINLNLPNASISSCQIARKIPKTPFKVLDAPDLMDDFYLNLVDWSTTDILAVGLGAAVYLWSACTSKITNLFEVTNTGIADPEHVTSVSWSPTGTHLAVGFRSGAVEIWDTSMIQKLGKLTGHMQRVGTMAWNGNILTTGSRDQKIMNRDLREKKHCFTVWESHSQEVCGLRWAPNERQLGSGGNDNRLIIWEHGATKPVKQFLEHKAAVKALAWSPHQNGLLASGGGTADRCIRFWNTMSGQPLHHVDTGSQVCNIAWSKTANELVSTHGYSLNSIIVWKYPNMHKISTLSGHTYRVLYLAVSPNGQTIVTGAGDETLRFWNVFPPTRPRISTGIQQMRFNRPPIIR